MALYDDASFIFLASGAARTDTKDFSKIQCVKPVEAVSSTDLAINGDFSIDGPGTDGALGTGFGSYGWNTVATDESTNLQEGTSTIKNGVLTLTNASGDVDARAYLTDGSSTRNILTTNSYYKLVYTVVENNGCTGFKVYNGAGAFEAAPSSVGTHTRVIQQTVNQLFVFTNTTESSSISIDNVSLKEFTTRNADFDISRDANLDATRVGPTGLIEKGRENKFLYSNNFSKNIGTWGHNGLSSVIGIHNSLGQEGYDGTNNASYIRASDATGVHKVLLTAQAGVSLDSTAIQTISIHAKPLGYTFLKIGTENAAQEAYFDLANGTVGTIGSDVIEAKITPAGNGYFRCSMTVNADQAINRIDFNIALEDNNDSFTGDPNRGGTDNGGIFIQDAQWELGLVPTEIISSTGSAGTAGLKEDEPRFDYPLAGGAPSLLLEPERTNLIKFSEYFGGSGWTDSSSGVTVVTNDAVSPEGVKNAAKLVIDNTISSSAELRVDTSLNPSVTNGEPYAFSVFAKAAGFNQIQIDVSNAKFGANCNVTATLTGDGSITAGSDVTSSSIENYGNGWYRITMVGTVTGSTGATALIFRLQADGINGTGDGSKGIHVYGAQFEEGPYASSYIPTHENATATRSGEGEAVDTFKATLPTALNGASAYTLFMDLTVTDLEEETDFRDVLIFRDSSGSKEAFKLETFFNNGTSSLRGFAYKTSQVEGATASIAHDTIAIGSRCKLAVVFNSASGIKAFYNGSSTPVLNYSEATTYESVDVIEGAEATVPGTRSRTRLHGIHGYPSALSDAQCISLTTL